VSPKLDDITNYRMDLFIAWEICKALDYAHRKDILHRDLKPSNVFLSTEGNVKVGDFGIAAFAGAPERDYTMVNVKTVPYAAPEQWEDERPTKETDVYQLGAALYHLFTKRLPFKGRGTHEFRKMHLEATPASPRSIATRVPVPLSEMILRALEKRRDDRPALWEINDVVAKELRAKYKVEIDVSCRPKSVRRKVAEITDFNLDKLSDGPFAWEFPDFNEAFSECVQLAVAGITPFAVRRRRSLIGRRATVEGVAQPEKATARKKVLKKVARETGREADADEMPVRRKKVAKKVVKRIRRKKVGEKGTL